MKVLNKMFKDKDILENKNRYEFEGTYSKIVIEEYAHPIIIKKSESDKLIFECYESKKYTYKIEMKKTKTNGEIIIKPKKKLKETEIEDVSLNNPLIVYIPENLVAEIEIVNEYSNINIENSCFNNLKVLCDSGTIILKNVKADDMSIKVMNADIYCENVLLTNNSEIYIKNGGVVLNKFDFGTYSNILAVDSNIFAKLESLNALYKFDLKTSEGQIHVDKYPYRKQVAILSRKSFKCRVKNGNININTQQ